MIRYSAERLKAFTRVTPYSAGTATRAMPPTAESLSPRQSHSKERSHGRMDMGSSITGNVSVDRLSLPDELNRLLKITDSKTWIAQFVIFGLRGVCVGLHARNSRE
jgi:hypothetical protein